MKSTKTNRIKLNRIKSRAQVRRQRYLRGPQPKDIPYSFDMSAESVELGKNMAGLITDKQWSQSVVRMNDRIEKQMEKRHKRKKREKPIDLDTVDFTLD